MANQGRLVPNYIEARSAKALRVLMFKTNVKDKAENQYFDIQTYKDRKGDTKFIAWYYSRISVETLTELG